MVTFNFMPEHNADIVDLSYNRLYKSHFIHAVVNKITFSYTVKTFGISEVNKASVQSVYCVTNVHNLQHSY